MTISDRMILHLYMIMFQYFKWNSHDLKIDCVSKDHFLVFRNFKIFKFSNFENCVFSKLLSSQICIKKSKQVIFELLRNFQFSNKSNCVHLLVLEIVFKMNTTADLLRFENESLCSLC